MAVKRSAKDVCQPPGGVQPIELLPFGMTAISRCLCPAGAAGRALGCLHAACHAVGCCQPDTARPFLRLLLHQGLAPALVVLPGPGTGASAGCRCGTTRLCCFQHAVACIGSCAIQLPAGCHIVRNGRCPAVCTLWQTELLTGSAVRAAAAIWCLWLLIPHEIDPQQVLPGALAFMDAQRSGPVLPASTAEWYPWLQPSAAAGVSGVLCCRRQLPCCSCSMTSHTGGTHCSFSVHS